MTMSTASAHTGTPPFLLTPQKDRSRVLIVDDAPENIRILGELLKDKYTVMFARNGEDALRLANGSPTEVGGKATAPKPDIILLDVIMPGMDGYEVCQKLKESPRTHDIPVLFITAQSDEKEESRGLSIGAVDYVSKPFRSTLVLTRVDNQLELKKHRDALDDLVKDRTKELSLTQEATIEAMASLAEWRDPETGMHIKRTQKFVKVLAEHMAEWENYADKLDAKTIELLYLSAPLHDVGKVCIPDAILQKPGRLTEDEFEQMKQHTLRGRDALSTADSKLGSDSFLRIARTIALNHHERWDGKGYPRGLAAEEIPLPAQLMSVADVYDALTSRRVYKPPMPHEKAKQLIVEGRATQFAPDVVDAFLAIEDVFIQIAADFADKEEDLHK